METDSQDQRVAQSAGHLIRPAGSDDASDLAALINIAGEGLPRWVWTLGMETSEDWLALGAAKAARDSGNFSWKNAWVAERDGRVDAMLLGYRLPDPYPDEDLATLPEPIRPLIVLEALAPGSWYVNALATLPGLRSQGLGSRLMEKAEQLARESGCDQTSLIVAEQNRRAVELYQRLGYAVVAQESLVPYPGCDYEGDWLLMTKPLS